VAGSHVSEADHLVADSEALNPWPSFATTPAKSLPSPDGKVAGQRACNSPLRTISIAEDEALQATFRKLQQTTGGRRVLRERTAVEHSLARIAAGKGHRARYRGVRKNEFDLRRAATIQNLEAIHRDLREAA